MKWAGRLWNMLRSGRLDREIDEELDFHLASRADDNIARE